MSEVEEGEIVEGDELDFKWGNLKEKTSDDIQLYESFTLDGVEYCLYDCVYLQHEDEYSVENHIGKIVKIMDHPDNQRKVKIVWFFRPTQVQKWLREREVSCLVHELFLASGEGLGVANVNPVEAIVGKCSVVCTSKDRRNPQPSIEERRKAEFVFSRTFDVQQCTFSHKLDNIISGIKVEHFFNSIEYSTLSGDQERKDVEVENPKSSGSQKDNLEAPIVQGGEDAKLKPKGELYHSSSLRSTSFEETPASLGDSAKRSLDGELKGNAMLVRKPKGGEDAKLKPKGELYHSSSLQSTSFEETASLGDSDKRSPDREFKGNAMLVRKPKGGEDAKLKPKGELYRSSSLRSTSVEETASLGDSAKRLLDGKFNGNAMLVRKAKGGDKVKLKSIGELYHSSSLRSTSFEETASHGDSAKRSLDGEFNGNAMLVQKPKGGEDAELKPKGELYRSSSLQSTSFEETLSLGDSDKRSPDREFKGNAMLVQKPKGGEDAKLKPKGELYRSSSLRSTSVEETASLGDSAKRSLDGEFNGNAMLVQKPKGGEDAKLKPKGELYRSSSLRSTSFEETASLGDSAKRLLDGKFNGNAMLVRKPKGGDKAKLKSIGELYHSSSLRSTSFEETASHGDSAKRSLDGEFNGNAMLVQKPKGGEDSKLKPKGELYRSSSLQSTSFEETASLGDSDKRSPDREFKGNAMLVQKPKGGEDAKLKPKGELYRSSSLRSTSVEETASLGDSAKRSLDGEFNGNAMLVQNPKGGEDAELKPKGELYRSSSLQSTSFEETASLGDTASRSLDGEFKGNAMLVRKPKMRCKDAGMSSGIHVSHDRKIVRGTSIRVSPRKTVKLAGFHVSHDRTFDRGTSRSVSLTKTGDLERKEFAPKPAGEKGRKDVQVIVRKGPTKFVVRRAAPDLAHEKGRNTQTQYPSFREPEKHSARHDRGLFTATSNDKKLHLNERREGARNLVRQDNWISRTLNRNDKRTLFSSKEAPEASQRKKMKSEIHTVEAQQNVDRSKWFKFEQPPSEEELDPVDRAYSEGTLVRLQNLDPSYSAAEIEEIMLNYLNVRCTAKVLPLCTFSSPHNGQAFLIFNTEEKAATVIKQLREKCLMLPNGRPLIAQRGVRKVLPEKSAKFFGHITIGRYRHREGKRAVSTSHCAQSNTVEYELALDWILQQRRSKATRKVLFELHGKELDALKAQLKNH
ncbi:hypothetical protein MKW92_052937 [Papaver armeniacum]|nr:hypothetical protein MKW92_052937 [Papaver armeniacum]